MKKLGHPDLFGKDPFEKYHDFTVKTGTIKKSQDNIDKISFTCLPVFKESWYDTITELLFLSGIGNSFLSDEDLLPPMFCLIGAVLHCNNKSQ